MFEAYNGTQKEDQTKIDPLTIHNTDLLSFRAEPKHNYSHVFTCIKNIYIKYIMHTKQVNSVGKKKKACLENLQDKLKAMKEEAQDKN